MYFNYIEKILNVFLHIINNKKNSAVSVTLIMNTHMCITQSELRDFWELYVSCT